MDSDEAYPLHKVSVPVYIHAGRDDLLVDPKDAMRLYNSLNKEYAKAMYTHEYIGHLGFVLTQGQDNYIQTVLDDIDELNN